MRIEYDGSGFSGWQFQPNARTVQGEIEGALLKITGSSVRIIGAGRTDQGVHALGQVANFKTETDLRLDQIQKGVNSLVGDDVFVKEAAEAGPEFNARFSAKSKVYEYRMIGSPSPVRRLYSWHVGYKLDIPRMEKAISIVKGEHDFTNFSAADAKHGITQEARRNGGGGSPVNTRCAVYGLFLTTNGFDIIITMKANRFLRKMARGIVGFMVDVGRGRFAPEDAHRAFSGELGELYFAPPQGLFLMEVIY
jgi:tRNA pseudouridine38-40 synthase